MLQLFAHPGGRSRWPEGEGQRKAGGGSPRSRCTGLLVLRVRGAGLRRRGYHTAKMQEVASEAGISLNTLYAIVPEQARGLRGAARDSRREFLAQVDAALAEPGDARESLRRGVHAFVDYLVRHPDYLRVDLREGRSWAVGDVEASPTRSRWASSMWTGLMKRGHRRGISSTPTTRT